VTVRYIISRNRTPLLRNLAPRSTPTLTDGQRGYRAALNLAARIRRSLAGSLESGMTTRDQVNDISQSLNDLTAFFRDLVQRETRVVVEGVANASDTELRYELDVSFREMCEYLEYMDEILFRLQNHGHLEHSQYLRVRNCFDFLRQLHREVFGYIDREPL
jgi:hypothetical protein